MLPKCCPNFTFDPWGTLDSLDDLNCSHIILFQGGFKFSVGGLNPPVLLPTSELPPILTFYSSYHVNFKYQIISLPNLTRSFGKIVKSKGT